MNTFSNKRLKTLNMIGGMMKRSLVVAILMIAFTCMASVAFAGMNEVVTAIEEVKAAQIRGVEQDDFKLICAKAQALITKGKKDGSLSEEFASEASWALHSYELIPIGKKHGYDTKELRRIGDQSLDAAYKIMKQSS